MNLHMNFFEKALNQVSLQQNAFGENQLAYKPHTLFLNFRKNPVLIKLVKYQPFSTDTINQY